MSLILEEQFQQFKRAKAELEAARSILGNEAKRESLFMKAFGDSEDTMMCAPMIDQLLGFDLSVCRHLKGCVQRIGAVDHPRVDIPN